MAQVEQPANLGRWHTPDGRALTLILMRCGLRVGDACHLAFDCIIRDADGASYLRYLNRKMKREALVPIDEEVEARSPPSSSVSCSVGPAVAGGCSRRHG
ncbi:site-specific integrase [Streptomyces alanosinicus]|uniref:Tyr recombinase domain-containing protein n=1 Tax=Streptomyces alanosinicus TaxID=68171 RepID=A0A919D7C6_9ACTN|nr:site-specific integrase [Streptomyces alanosinicus]GHE13916.1 hypothetical protein GCM10010339_82770 [Streptomyces alanosinicus]